MPHIYRFTYEIVADNEEAAREALEELITDEGFQCDLEGTYELDDNE